MRSKQECPQYPGNSGESWKFLRQCLLSHTSDAMMYALKPDGHVTNRSRIFFHHQVRWCARANNQRKAMCSKLDFHDRPCFCLFHNVALRKHVIAITISHAGTKGYQDRLIIDGGSFLELQLAIPKFDTVTLGLQKGRHLFSRKQSGTVHIIILL